MKFHPEPAHAAAEVREREAMLYDLIRLGEASVARLQAQLDEEERQARREALAGTSQRLDNLLQGMQRRSALLNSLAPVGPRRIAPKMVARTSVAERPGDYRSASRKI